MAFSDILRGAGRGVASIGRAVRGATQKLDQIGQPQAAPAAAGPAPAEGAPAQTPKGFPLPDLGPPPDPASPDFQGEVGAAKLAEAQESYAHRQKVHDSLMQLDKVFAEAHPGRDFEGEYRSTLAEQQAGEEGRPQGSALARFALGLGDFNPAVKSSNLDRYNKEVGEEGDRFEQSAAKRTMLKLKMHEQAAADAETKGNWKKALAERERADMMSFEKERREARDYQKRVETQQKGATERANIRADAARSTAETRAKTIGRGNGLKGTFLDTYMQEAAKAMARHFNPQDLTKSYTLSDLETATDELENLAEMYEKLQKRAEDRKSGAVSEEPTETPAKKPGAKEKF